MQISEEGIKLIKKYEGCRLKAYRDPAGILTIGYGHTRNVTIGQTITEAKATEFLKQDLVKAQTEVSKYHKKYTWTQNEFDALVSFAFNVGSITALTKFGSRSKKQIAEKMLLYVNAGGKKLEGLVKRRKEEHDLFLKAAEVTPNIIQGYQVGKQYTVVVNGLTVRKAPSVGAAKALKTGYNKGKKVTCHEVVRDVDGNTWIKIDSQKNYYYICAIYKGKVYVD